MFLQPAEQPADVFFTNYCYYQLISQLSLSNNHYGNNNTKTCFIYKKRNYQLIRYIKKEYNKAKKEFKRYVHQYLIDNNFNNFNKDIVPTTTSGNFFYNNYSVKYFITLNRLILIKTAKNIIIFINNNAFVYSLTGNIELGNTEPNSTESSTARRSNKVNIENFTVNINFLNYYFNNNGQDLAFPPIFPYSL